MNASGSEPLVPPDVDLRDYPYMPVDIVRLFGSEFHAVSDDTAWRAGVTLWLRSYHQVPAASVPDDDVALARLAELGRDHRTWRKIKAAALRGWRKCSDGRLYHPVVAEKALEGWIEKLNQRKSSLAGNAKRYGAPFDPVQIDGQIEDARTRLAGLNPHSRILTRRPPKTGTGSPDDLPPGGNKAPGGSLDHPSFGSQEKRREAKGREPISAALPARARTSDDLDRIENALLDAIGLRGNPPASLRNLSPVLGLLDRGLNLEEDILPVARSKAGQSFTTWKYITNACLDAHASRVSSRSTVVSIPRGPPGLDHSAARQTSNPALAAVLRIIDE